MNLPKLLGPVLRLLGALIIFFISFIWGACAFRRDSLGHPIVNYFRRIVGLACFGVLLFYLYTRSSPDQCSRVITDTQYEVCFEGVFAEMTIAEARQWLVANDFRAGRIIESNPTRSLARDKRHAHNPAYGYDLQFKAFRDFGEIRSVRYGTDFNRFFCAYWTGSRPL